MVSSLQVVPEGNQMERDAALMSTAGGMLGAFTGTFVIAMALAWILMRIANSEDRNVGTAAALRLAAVIWCVMVLVFSSGWIASALGAGTALAITGIWWRVAVQREVRARAKGAGESVGNDEISSAQLVGSRCAICEGTIKIAFDGKRCSACGATSHVACLDEKPCPECGKPA